MNDFIYVNFNRIRALLVILIVLLAGACVYLFVTQPDKSHEQPPQVSFFEANPIAKKLPYKDPYYIISYKTIGTTNDIIITIHTPSPRYRYYALKQMYALGFDPTDYIIEYPQYTNPLGGK